LFVAEVEEEGERKKRNEGGKKNGAETGAL
jgi:hypothetical protein